MATMEVELTDVGRVSNLMSWSGWSGEKFQLIIEKKLTTIRNRRSKLILVVVPSSTDKTKLLQYLREVNSRKYVYINLNMELSALLKDVTVKERPYRVQEFLREIVSDKQRVLLVDNTEILFDPELKLDPMKSLLELSRSNTVVAVWSGMVKAGVLFYAKPGRREYYRGQIGDLEIIDLTS